MSDDLSGPQPGQSDAGGARDWRDDPQPGTIIALRHPARNAHNCARQIIAVENDRVLTVGMSGRQRDRWMAKARLRAYERVT